MPMPTPPCVSFSRPQATEKQAQTPNPPPETFHPLSSKNVPQKGAGKGAVDPASLEAAAASAAETLANGSPQEVGSARVLVVFWSGLLLLRFV